MQGKKNLPRHHAKQQQNLNLQEEQKQDETITLEGKIDYMTHLRVSIQDRECPFNRSKLFVLGRAGSGKEAVLASLFGLNLREDTIGDMQPIRLGMFDSKTFNRVTNFNRRRISMDVWNYSWKAVYNYLQHLYMTEFTLYLFVFDMKKVLSDDEAVRNETLTYLKNILNNKKLQAPNSPVLLVGSNRKDLSDKDITECNQIIFFDVLQNNQFMVQLMQPGVTVGAVCCDTGNGLENLRAKISQILTLSAYVQENVPVTILKAEKLLKQTELDYMPLTDVRKWFYKIGVKDDYVCELILKILAERGIITFVHNHEPLRKFIIINPDWLIGACGIAIYKDGQHRVLDYDILDANIVADFNIFVYQRVLSKRLLSHILERMQYPKEVHGYLLDLMKSTCMIGEYLIDNVESYLTPTFFDNLRTRNYQRQDIINEEQYKGPFFVLDFSGNHSSKVVSDGSAVYCSYLPFSFFEKLVSLSIQLSATFGRGVQPITRYKKARLSFGAEVDFMLSVMEEMDGRPLKIKVSTFTGTKQEKANDLVERIFSMAKGIRKDFYPGIDDKSKLTLALLVPPTSNDVSKLTNYEEIQVAKAANTNVFPNFHIPGSLPTSEFDRWHRDGRSLQVGSKVVYTPKQADGCYSLPDNKDHHCFLSYKETSALQVVQKQLTGIKALGYKCWLNKEYKGELNETIYLENVKRSMCFILVLSANVFESPIIINELKTAKQCKVPILFLHHPDTDKFGYWTFQQYIKSCPAELRHLFVEVVSIPLQERFYLQEAVTNKLAAQIKEIYGKSMAKTQ